MGFSVAWVTICWKTYETSHGSSTVSVVPRVVPWTVLVYVLRGCYALWCNPQDVLWDAMLPTGLPMGGAVGSLMG